MIAAGAERTAEDEKFKNSLDKLMSSVTAKRGAVTGLCEQLFIEK